MDSFLVESLVFLHTILEINSSREIIIYYRKGLEFYILNHINIGFYYSIKLSLELFRLRVLIH